MCTKTLLSSESTTTKKWIRLTNQRQFNKQDQLGTLKKLECCNGVLFYLW